MILCPEASNLRAQADALAESGDFKGSLSLFLEAVALCPASEVLHEAIGQLHDELGEHEPAFRSAARAVEMARNVWRPLFSSSM